MLVSEAFERYRQERIVFANKSAKTEEAYAYTQKALLKFLGGDPELCSLTFDSLRAWKISLEKQGLGIGTVRGYIVNTRAVLRYMQLLGEDCVNPELIPLPKRRDPVPHVISAKEVADLIKLIKSTPKCSRRNRLRNMAIVSLLYSSGIRVSEMCSLDRHHLHDGYFTVENGKGSKSRPAYLDERTQQLLKDYLALREDSNPALFVDGVENGRLTPGNVQALFRRVSRRAGLNKPIHPHTLRHSYATNLMQNGCHIYPLSRLMGHSSIATTQVYLHLFDGELAEIHRRYHSV